MSINKSKSPHELSIWVVCGEKKLLCFKTYKVLEQVKVCRCRIARAKTVEFVVFLGLPSLRETTPGWNLHRNACLNMQSTADVNRNQLVRPNIFVSDISENFPLPLKIYSILMYLRSLPPTSPLFSSPLLSSPLLASPLLASPLLSSPLLSAETDLRLLWR